MRKLNKSQWSDGEIINLIQVLLISKFDSGKSEILMGAPVIQDLLHEAIAWSFQEEWAKEFVKVLCKTPVYKNLHNLIINSVASEIRASKPYMIDYEYLRRLVFPYTISEEVAGDLIRQARRVAAKG